MGLPNMAGQFTSLLEDSVAEITLMNFFGLLFDDLERLINLSNHANCFLFNFQRRCYNFIL